MNTVQIVVSDFHYAQALEALFLRDGHPVTVTDAPNLNLDGVVVVEAAWLERIDFENRPDRFVVISGRSTSTAHTDLWAAGIRYIVYREDPIEQTHLAVLAAELRLAHVKS